MSHASQLDPSSETQAAYGGVVRMLTGHWTVQAIYVFAKLGIADRIGEQVVPAADLARDLAVDEASLFRILRGLAATGLLHARDDDAFALTPMGALLRSDVPDSLRDLAIMSGEEQYAGWGKLLDAVREGSSAFEQAHGAHLFEYLRNHPSAASTFDGAMVGLSGSLGNSVAEQLDMSRFQQVVDLGGGRGVFLSRILHRHQHLNGIVFDLPHVAAGAGAYMGTQGLLDRCVAIGGDFFEEIPEDGDLYIFCQTLFNWSDERVDVLLRGCRERVEADGALVVVEQMIGEPSSPFAAMMDLQMMAMPGGRVRTVAEYEGLLDAAGFDVTQRMSLAPLGATVLEARPR
ncbi:MAG: hypothetical protein K0V04_35380 [Deltaproteobacteria bacterium]|nr:hypothetical protein [Deltaproteobacteria bacterium]